MLNNPSRNAESGGNSSEENVEGEQLDKNKQAIEKNQQDLDNHNEENILDELGNLEINELENVVSFADRIAFQTAIVTSM